MNLFRNFASATILVLVCAIYVFAQTEEAIRSDRLEINKGLENTKLLDNFTPLEDYLIPGNTGQLINASTYVFLAQNAVALEDMSSGTTTLVAASQDDTASAVTNIGFDVWFDGARYTQFSVNANGLLGFGPTVVNNAASGRTNDFATTTNNPKVAAYWDDLCTNPTGKVHYKVVGTPGNRRLIVEWTGMVTFGTSCTTGLALGTFQVWVKESASASQPGVVQFVYGALGANSTANAGYSVGIGSASTSFASVSSTSDSVSYATSDNAQVAAVAAGKSYTFTPNVPAAPTIGVVSGITQTSLTLNWLDNATNEVGYAIYRSTDNVNFSFLTQAAVNSISYTDAGLSPGTQYFYTVQAVSEGALSSAAATNATTSPAGNISCNGAGGTWSSTSTWAGGIVPGAGDNVTISTGCAVSINTDAAALSLTVNSGGGLEFESGTARTLTVTSNVTNSGTIQSSPAGTVTTHVLSVGGNLINNGILDFSTNGDTAGAELRFTGAANASLSGTGATTDLRLLTVNKGAGTVTTSSPTLDVNLSNMSVRGSTSGGTFGFLNTATFNGIVKFSGTNTLSDIVFQTAAYSIPATGGVWLNNPNFSVAGQNGSPTLLGLLRISNGTLNIGTSTGNSIGFGTGSTIIVEGGAVNAAGRFGVSAATSIINYNQSGGTITVQTVGNTSTTLAGFDLGTATGSSATITGGTIVVQLANTGGSGPRDYRHQAGSATTTGGIAAVTGGTLQLGNAASGAAKTFTMRGVVPNLVIDNTSAGHTGQWDITLVNWNNISRNITINPTTTLNLGNVIFLFSGTTFTNNGTLTHNGASSRTYFFGAGALAPQTYTGSGTVTPATSWDFDNALGVTLDASVSNIITNRVILFAGNINNSSKLTIGNGGTTAATIQIGNTTTPTLAGVFDSTPTFNAGTGGHVYSYLRTGASRVTGPEMTPGRSITNLTYNDNDPTHTLTIAGGNLTVTGALTLTEGAIITNDSNVLKHNGTATRTNGFVNGPLMRDFAAAGTYTYHLGQNGYSPMLANVTAGTGSLTARAIDAVQPNVPNPAKAISRYWKLAGTGITSDLTFTYLDPADIPGTVTESSLAILKYDGAFSFPGGSVNTAANTATITGVTSFSDWTLAEPGALAAPGVLALSGASYSANENSGSITVTVNRTSGTDGAVTVDYSLGGGTATGGASCGAGIDYVNTGGTVSFATGETSKNFNVTLCGDTDVEADETFNVTLSNPTGGASIGTPSTATATILNDDSASSPVTVTATAGTPTGNYTNLTGAIAAVNDGTHQGSIVINVNQTISEPGTVVINSSGAGAANYTLLLIRPTADGLTVSGASAQGRGLIELNGADNVIIDGDNPNSGGTNRNLTLQNTAANTVTFTSVIRIALAAAVPTADNNTFRNLNILGSATGRNIGTANTTTGTENNGFGILAGLGATGATTAPAAIASVTTGAPAGTTANNLLVSNNSVTTAARGISINGAAATVFPGLQVNNNSIGNPTAGAPDQVYAIGITAQGSPDGLISGNTVWVEGFAPTGLQGINVSTNSTVGTFTVELNKVNRVRNNNVTTFGAYGINLGGSTNHVVRNNFVSGVINDQTAGTGAFSTTFGAFGIRILGTGHKVYHNSVHLYGAMPGTTSTNLTAALAIVGTTQTGLDVRNNIFSNQISGGNPASPGTRNVAVFLPSGGTSAMNLTLNNNAYYVGTDALNRLAQVGTTFGTGEFPVSDFDPTQTTPATNLRAYTSTLSAAGTNDNASFASATAPPFVSNVDLHVPNGTATRLESGGAAVGVATDIDIETRNATTPDIGADEFGGTPPAANDIAASAFVTPPNGATIPTGAAFSPQARFTNNGTATQTNVTVRYRIIDSSMTVIYNQTATIATIAPLQSVVVTFPSTSIANPGTYTIEASAELAGDANTSNDKITGSINAVSPIGGTVTVGAGGTYPSLTNPGGLFQALNLAGISGNLTVNITSDLTGETGAVPLNQLVESGVGGYTVTIKPSGAARTITGTSAANSGLIILHGADRIVFDGSLSGGTDRSLTITNNQATGGIVIWMRSPNAGNGATNNTVKNCILNGAPGPNSTTVAGVLTGSSVTLGGDAEAPNSNNTIQNNWIYRVQNSMYLRGGAIAANFDQNWTVVGNELGSTNANDKNIFRGMLIGNSANFTISGNTVHGIQSTGTTTAIMSGIQLGLLLSNGTVTNNVISDIKNVSATGTGAGGITVIATSTASNVTIANNFIYDIAANGSATVSSNGHGISFLSLAPGGSGYNLYFNSVNLNTNQPTAQTTAALFITSTFNVAGAINARNNIFANTQTTGNRFGVFSQAPASVFSAIDYNDYFAQNVGFIGGAARPTLADWQAATGQDANSKAVDPLFVSPTDLHLQITSPLIAMGVSGTGVTTDIDGQTRDNPPDIGADELPAGTTPGSVQFDSATYSVSEAGGTVTLTVTRTGGSAGAISVNYSTANGTATGGASCAAGIDFVNASGTLNWASGDTASKSFNVTICNDVVFEANETFTATLAGATGGATIGSPNPATVTITNDDPEPPGAIAVNDVRVTEGNTGGANAVFTVTYTGINPASASVDYATANGTALAGVDFLATSGTISFATGAVQTVAVPIIGKTLKEANETFFLNLSNPINAAITDNQGVGIIVDEDRAYVADFDRDWYSDLGIVRPGGLLGWYVLQSASSVPDIRAFGTNGDRPVPGDYDGDGKTDFAVFRASEGNWYVNSSLSNSVQIKNWGTIGDKPVQGDYDGDGKTDFAVYRPSTGTWWITRSSDNGSSTVVFGISTDRLVQGDYDGDFKTDVAVYRNGTWFITLSSNSSVVTQNFGLASDLPVSGDFDGDGKFDLAVFRPSSGDFWVFRSLTGTAGFVHWGQNGDIPVPADYDRDGTTDYAIFRPSTGEWYVLRSSNGSYFSLQWGQNGDFPIPAGVLPQ